MRSSLAYRLLKRHFLRPRLKYVENFTVLLGIATVNLYIKYEVSTFTHYEDMKSDEKCKNWGGLGG